MNKRLTEDVLYFTYKDGFGKFIHLDDLGISFEEAMNCVFLDIDHETKPGSIDLKEKIISTGIGCETKFY